MRKYIVVLASIFAFIATGCKKNDAGSRADQLRKMIRGDWYYQSIRRTYYVGSLPKHFVDATAQEVFEKRSFKFNDDNTISINGNTFNYELTSNNGADSLYVKDSDIPKFAIVSLNENAMTLSHNYLARVSFIHTITKETFTSTHIGEISNLVRTKNN